ncbi:response regulator [Hymenobacter algoricola]|uniref:Response regulator n=1 Tax=Hymenobacter algoricola TaxID=486267 RepID=A0ABP7NIW1_9BACT
MVNYPLRPLLVVEDNAEDFTALSRVFRKLGLPNLVVRCEDGDQALAYLQGHGQAADWPGALPALVLLDLNLPGTDGRTVLETLKKDPTLQALPVVVLSTSSSTRDVEHCYQLGANGYLTKPIQFAALEAKLKVTMQYWLEASELPQIN